MNYLLRGLVYLLRRSNKALRRTVANIGLDLASIENPDACYWLNEAYALREYLEDQGKGLEESLSGGFLKKSQNDTTPITHSGRKEIEE